MKTKLLNKGDLAAALGVNRSMVTAMVKAGFQMPAGRATVDWALDWLKAHPDFQTSGRRRKAATASAMSAGSNLR